MGRPIHHTVVLWPCIAVFLAIYVVNVLLFFQGGFSDWQTTSQELVQKMYKKLLCCLLHFELTWKFLEDFKINVLNLADQVTVYQTADHPALSPKSGSPEWRVAITWKTRQKHPPIDLAGGRGDACMWFGLAHFHNGYSFCWFLQTYLTSGPCSFWFFLVLERCIFL